METVKLTGSMLFLSTLSLRRATTTIISICIVLRFLSTLSLRRATIMQTKIVTGYVYIFLSTLSLRRATSLTLIIGFLAGVFLSTLSLRRATPEKSESLTTYFISIHALLAESDHPKTSNHPHNTNFYPRSPCGERLLTEINKLATGQISIHALLAESDGGKIQDPRQVLISIHALLAESDSKTHKLAEQNFKFLSTLSLRRATYQDLHRPPRPLFLSTLSLRRATSCGW